jgi:flagellum-specific peptidoglycan hydrolase FlgJ
MKIKNIFIALGLCVFIASCGSKKGIVTKKSKEDRKELAGPKNAVMTTSDTEDASEDIKLKTPTDGMTTTEAYIYGLSDIAKDEMRKYGIPASITLAQGILESGSGKGRLSVEANNHFGIKCHDWTGAKIYHDDDAKQECFRKYNNIKYSYRDHSLFLTSRKRYMDLFRLGKDDYKGWAKGLKKAGYATDRKYPQKLIALIERHELYKLDAEVLGKDLSDANRTLVVDDKHTVVKGDTLYSLSRKYKTTVKVLQELNGLDSTQLHVGQVLYVKPLQKDY